MTEARVQLDSEAKVVTAIEKAVARQALTPLPDRFLAAQTVTDMTDYNTNLPAAIVLRDNAEDALATDVINLTAAGDYLRILVPLFFMELNGRIALGQNPKSVRRLFDLNEETGNLPDIDSEDKLVAVCNKIQTGNATMVTNGNITNTAFKAAEVVTKRDAYVILLGTRDTSKDTLRDAQNDVADMIPLAKAVADDIAAQTQFKFRSLTASQIRDKMRLWGSEFETIKPKTKIALIVLLPDGVTPAAGAEGRIGDYLTKSGRISREGVKGNANVLGELILETTTTGRTSIVVRILNCADSITDITIVAETNQTHTITMVAGVSSL